MQTWVTSCIHWFRTATQRYKNRLHFLNALIEVRWKMLRAKMTKMLHVFGNYALIFSHPDQKEFFSIIFRMSFDFDIHRKKTVFIEETKWVGRLALLTSFASLSGRFRVESGTGYVAARPEVWNQSFPFRLTLCFETWRGKRVKGWCSAEVSNKDEGKKWLEINEESVCKERSKEKNWWRRYIRAACRTHVLRAANVFARLVVRIYAKRNYVPSVYVQHSSF